MATKAWRDEQHRRSTSFEDLQAIVKCSTRMAILVALSGGPMHVTDLCRALGFDLPLLSNHLKLLRETGVVEFETEAGHRVYHLVSAPPFVVTESGLTLDIAADDGSTLSGMIPKAAALMRVLERAIAASKATRSRPMRPAPVVVVRPPGRLGSRVQSTGKPRRSP